MFVKFQWVSVQGGVSVQGEVSVQGVSVQGVFVQESLSEGISVQGVSVRGVSAQEGSLSRRVCVGRSPSRNQKSRWCTSLLECFLFNILISSIAIEIFNATGCQMNSNSRHASHNFCYKLDPHTEIDASHRNAQNTLLLNYDVINLLNYTLLNSFTTNLS